MKMKKYIYGLSILLITSFSACEQKVELSEDFFGHYVTPEYIEAYKKDKNYINNSVLMKELVFLRNDSLLSYFEINKSKKEFKYNPTNNDRIVVPNFFGSLVDAEIKINKKGLTLTNINTNEQFQYIKIEDSDLEFAKEKRYTSYGIPYLNSIIIKGSYLNFGKDTIQFTESSDIIGIPEYKYYSICLSKMCREFNQGNTIFFSKQNNEGEFYEYEFKNDSLYIYKLDAYKAMNRRPSERIQTIVAAKKLN